MRIAVTGGMGFIGQEVVARLLTEGHEVMIVDYWKKLIPLYEGHGYPILQELYRDIPRCYAVAEPWEFVQDILHYRPEIIVHAGAVVDTTDYGTDDLFERNVTFTQDLTTNASEIGSHIIFFSSAAVYGEDGHPNNPYGLTKAIGEKIIRRSKTRTASIRLFNVFGRNEHHKGAMASMPWKISQAFKSGKEIEVHSMESKRDFVPVDSVVDAVVQLTDVLMAPKSAVETGQNWHKEFDVGTGLPTSFRELIHHVARATGIQMPYPVKEIEMPRTLIGRYQHYTCAGKHAVENLGGKIGTPEGLVRSYG